ncbi:glycosyltransferase family 4 protein [Massilia atriviolacea]|uniref:Glycosyltransferase n=1 Tax=Massilia atriviolacea TaxID=2495579 RepID=A0A430HN75_9BURK|nr:glycosyltransferase [Massilia atriviolacea]RSZ59007.1 glycosyltransferase [Massilia atriviolacea]
MRRLKVLTWHTHGSYLYYLSQAPHEFYVLSKPGRPPGYGGRTRNMPWGDNVHDMPASEARHHQFDCIVFQDDAQYEKDQYEFLSASQRALPRIYLEHDPPRAHPTDTRHPVDTAGVLLVHVTHFNALMWDSGATPTCVIEHGVKLPDGIDYSGQLDCGLVVVNHLARRGRRLGADIFEAVRAEVPLELVGMAAQELGGLGEIEHARLPAFAARYRYLFNPIRYTSLGLAVIEAMMVGMPVVALATTEMASVIDNGESGFIDTRLATLVEHMRELGRTPALARALGARARKRARERFAIGRFCDDWDRALRHVTGLSGASLRS